MLLHHLNRIGFIVVFFLQFSKMNRMLISQPHVTSYLHTISDKVVLKLDIAGIESHYNHDYNSASNFKMIIQVQVIIHGKCCLTETTSKLFFRMMN